MHTKNVQNIAKAAQKTQYQTHIIRPYVRKTPSPILFFQTNNKSRNSTLAQTGKISAVRCLFTTRAEVNYCHYSHPFQKQAPNQALNF